MTTPTELLVPPRRLGRLLADARMSRGMSLEHVSAGLGGRLSDLDLLEIETGRRAVADGDIQVLAELYGLETAAMIPARSRLVVDLDEGTIQLGGTAVSVDRPEGREDVLGRYLAMVYAMRDARPGEAVPLRLDDLEVLSDVLALSRRDVEDRLHRMMLQQPEPVRRRFKLLRGRVVVPVVGVLVAATAAGALLLVDVDDSGADQGRLTTDPIEAIVPADDGPAGGADADAPVAPVNPRTEIGDAVVQERNPDGTPGSVEVRS